MEADWLHAWRAAAHEATSLVVVAGDHYDRRRRDRTPAVVTVRDRAGIAGFAEAIDVAEDSDDDVALMMWPTLTFALLKGRAALAQLSYLADGWVRPHDGRGDYRLRDVAAIDDWLTSHGLRG